MKKIRSGNQHTLLIKNDGSLWVQGSNLNGQIGLGDTESAPDFVRIPVDEEVVDIDCATYASFYVTKSGKLFATGRNDGGNLGLGETTRFNTFTRVL